MKNISVILNVVLFIAVGVLYYLHFKGDKCCEESKSTSVKMLPQSNAGIVFVNSDSLLDEYDFYKNKKSEFEQAQSQIKAELKTEGEKLQKEVEMYQQQAAGMTEAQRGQKEEQLQMKQQQIMQRKDELLGKLDDQQDKSSQELYAKLNEYLKKHYNGKNLNYVLGYQKGGGILFANDSLNITREVILGLNKEYKEENK